MKTLRKKILSALFLSMLLGMALAPIQIYAAPPTIDLLSDPTDVNSFQAFDAGSVANDPRVLIKRFINIAMGFLGMIAILIILYAGFMWMTAAGDKERLETAHKLLKNGIIGLIIIFSAWTIAWFVVNTLQMNVRKQV